MACSCVIEALAAVQITAVCLYSAALAQLTTPGHGYNADMTQQDGTTGRAMFSAVER
jgi:trimethylamine:corrinoid methyltransferase-like protein